MIIFKNKKYLCTLIALLMALLMLVSLASCNDTTDTPDFTDGTTTSSSEVVETSPNIDLVVDGVSKFKLIRSDTMNPDHVSYVSKLGQTITSLTGAKIEYVTDFLRKGTERSEADEKVMAIIIGDTNYKASAEVMKKVKTYNSFYISVIGDQIVIGAYDQVGIAAAVSVFSNVLEDFADTKTKTLSIPRDYSYDYTSTSVLGKVPICEYGMYYDQGDCGDQAYMVTHTQTTEADFKSYVEHAVSQGLTKYAENKIGSNSFVTLQGEGVILNASYIAVEGRIRLIADNPKNTAIHPISSNKTGDLPTLLTQVGLEYNYDNPSNPYKFTESNWQIGLAYIFRLSDGSFIVLDGGYNKDRNAKMLYDEMRSQMESKTDKITIAAWIFTHVHGDHIGAFKRFMDMYKYEVNLEYVIYNTGSPAQQESANEKNDGMASAANTAKNYIPTSRILIARPGQKMTFSNATLEMYHTSELLPDSVLNGNSLCIAFRIVAAGQSFFFTGDCNTDASNTMVRMYGSALQSDFEQINHHGAGGPTNELHAAIDPTVVLWPLGEYDYFYDPKNPGKITRSRESYNTYLFESPKVKEIILAGHTTRTLTLPYTFPIVRVDPVQTAPFD